MTALLTAFALIAFASNSILCRLALGPREIDAASFSSDWRPESSPDGCHADDASLILS